MHGTDEQIREADALCEHDKAREREQQVREAEAYDREQELEAEARNRCRWQNDPVYEVSRAPGTRLPVYREQYAGNWRSKPICEKGTPPDVQKAAARIAERLTQPTP